MTTPQARVPAHEIVIVQTEQERQQCYDVRIEVFHHEQKFPLETEFDSMEDTAIHILLRLTPSLKPIGTIRGYKIPGTSNFKLTRLAVLKEYRQFKFGRSLVLTLHDWVRQNVRREIDPLGNDVTPKFVDIICHSQIPVKGFYARFGYQPEGDEFDEDGDPHQKMALRLPID